jgi:hypothetical protein
MKLCFEQTGEKDMRTTGFAPQFQGDRWRRVRDAWSGEPTFQPERVPGQTMSLLADQLWKRGWTVNRDRRLISYGIPSDLMVSNPLSNSNKRRLVQVNYGPLNEILDSSKVTLLKDTDEKERDFSSREMERPLLLTNMQVTENLRQLAIQNGIELRQVHAITPQDLASAAITILETPQA